MYYLKAQADALMPTAAQGYRAEEEEEEQINYDMIDLIHDIDEVFGEPIIITDWSIYYHSAKYNNIVISYAKTAILIRFRPAIPTLQYKPYI